MGSDGQPLLQMSTKFEELRDGDLAALVGVVDDVDAFDQLLVEVRGHRSFKIDILDRASFMTTVAVYILVMLAG